MEKGEEQEIEAAYHAAGHAFVLLALGGGLERVTLLPALDSPEGICQAAESLLPPYLHGIVCLAGFAAFQRLQPEPTEEELQRHLHADRCRALGSANAALFQCLEAELPDTDATGADRARRFGLMQAAAALLVDLCTREANRLVEEGWEGIEAIALALLDAETLSGAKAARLAESALPAFSLRPAPAEAEQLRQLAVTYYHLMHPTLLSGEAA